jgi:hypothetical protein
MLGRIIVGALDPNSVVAAAAIDKKKEEEEPEGSKNWRWPLRLRYHNRIMEEEGICYFSMFSAYK